MRSLANDIREGCKLPGYEIRDRFSDGKGGYCAIGVAVLFVDGNKKEPNHVEARDRIWPEQSKHNIPREASSRHLHGSESREQIADWVEQREWVELGIPTRAMKEELNISSIPEETKVYGPFPLRAPLG